MEGHRIGETNFSQSGPSNHHLTYAFQHGLITNSPTATNFIQQGSAFDFGELEEAIVLQGVNFRNDEAKKSFFTTRPAATLEMFPAWPMRIQPTLTGSSKSVGGGGGPGVEESTTGSGSVVAAQMNNTTTVACKPDFIWEPDSPISKKSLNQVFDQKQQQHNQEQQQKQLQIEVANETTKATGTALLHIQQQAPKTLEKRKGAGSTSNKPLDPKTLRRLAQNREAAKKSRLRKKAYVQQLESSRIKLAQLEQDLHRARSQGLFLAAAGGAGGNLSSEATLFDMEYARWIEEEHGHISELRTGLQAHLSDGELRVILDRYLSHYDDIFRLKGMATKSDVFHLITGMWITPAERCFLWMGGFRPSELLKVLMPQLDSLTEQQFMGICSLQQCSQQAEEALSQGLDQLYHSLTDTISSNGGGTGSLSCINSDGSSSTTNVGDFMGQMALALGKLSNLQGFLSQADNLRQQTLHQLRRILTVRQAARCFLAIGEYYNRLRSLSSLWATRPRENFMSDDNSCQTTTDLHMVQQAHNQFSSF